uniref:Uncharacterized protein n=1 Tax=Arundo donax TaxID=35708 RepID=A0A0A9F0P0_ARUDO
MFLLYNSIACCSMLYPNINSFGLFCLF